MIQEIAVCLGFAGGLGEGAWGLEENEPWGSGEDAGGSLFGWG